MSSSGSDSVPLTAKGYGISDTKKYTDFTVKEFKLKTPGPNDVTLDIECCGVCGSDVHTITGGWGDLSADWICPGHEIIGKVTHIGDSVKEFKVGQRVGVGAQVYACLKCDRCKQDNENYCPEQVDTYNAPYPDGVMAQGGYSTTIRAHERWVFEIPDSIESQHAAPLLCAGLTVYSPLKRNGVTSGKTVGIIGIGGLGHLAIQFAKAMGAKVIVFSHSPSKEKDCMDLGANEFVVADKDDFAKPYFDKLDFLLSAADVESIPLSDYMTMLKVGGKVVSVGLPDSPWDGLKPQMMASNASAIGTTHIGSKVEVNEMLAIAAKHGIKPVIDQILPMKEAAKAIESVKTNKVRYRFVLKQDLV